MGNPESYKDWTSQEGSLKEKLPIQFLDFSQLGERGGEREKLQGRRSWLDKGTEMRMATT